MGGPNISDDCPNAGCGNHSAAAKPGKEPLIVWSSDESPDGVHVLFRLLETSACGNDLAKIGYHAGAGKPRM
jgi:hypothetical protein